jgi:hypothetical protein
MKRLLTLAALVLVVNQATVHSAELLKLMGVGDLPLWAQTSRLYKVTQRNAQHWLAEVVGCTSAQQLNETQTVQCHENFLYLQPGSTTGKALATITNVQSAGRVEEALATETRVGTLGSGHVRKAVLYDGRCYGHVDDCVGLRTNTIEFDNGFRLRADGNRLELVAPDGTVRMWW